ncbi:uncharacterized protein [Sinocyclocheilus grahami]|uniref:uncharacterized protein n=1 Tax=Sinocyclocheilus grahami TaxID=75366 RepID=UPI0007AD32F0|nr:PREDICTED: uncharacterized protein LOC107577117 [Sinocyclocheilus grahami]
MAEEVLRQIERQCYAIERAYHNGICGQRHLHAIEACLRNLSRVASLLRTETANELKDSLIDLRRNLLAQNVEQDQTYSAGRVYSGICGRPSINVSKQQIEFLMKQGHTVKQMAKILGCSSSFIYRKTKLLGIPIRKLQTQVTEEELTQHVRRLHSLYPNTGSEIMRGLLRAEGLFVQRRRVRETLTQIDPTAAARRWSSAIARRVYHVPHPNSLWHIDGNMRLIRWGFVVHGAIDGKSRLITYLSCNTNNRASAVLTQFVKATCLYGLPSRVRSDHGGENSQIALFMNLVQGVERRSHITGESVHNQRIERLWRDVFLHVLQYFYNLFHSLEDSEVLDPDDDVHKMSLQIVFLPEIQKRLDLFRNGWNHHKMRTENNKTPVQIWTAGMLSNMEANCRAISNVFGEDPYSTHTLEELLAQHGIDNFPVTDDEEDHFPAVVVEQPRINLSHQQQQNILQTIETISDATDKYQTCCREIANILQDG